MNTRHKRYKLLLWGGNANNGSNCGLAYSNSNNAWSNSNSNYSARQTIERNQENAVVYTAYPIPPSRAQRFCRTAVAVISTRRYKVSRGKTTCTPSGHPETEHKMLLVGHR